MSGQDPGDWTCNEAVREILRHNHAEHLVPSADGILTDGAAIEQTFQRHKSEHQRP